MDRNALAELLQALESRRDAEERRREERYTALIERHGQMLSSLPALVPNKITVFNLSLPGSSNISRIVVLKDLIKSGLKSVPRAILENSIAPEGIRGGGGPLHEENYYTKPFHSKTVLVKALPSRGHLKRPFEEAGVTVRMPGLREPRTGVRQAQDFSTSTPECVQSNINYPSII
ncbi:UNVERIFIED_CONTAM: hypothetical protein FKN15_020245 [Acipenser sinensis]